MSGKEVKKAIEKKRKKIAQKEKKSRPFAVGQGSDRFGQSPREFPVGQGRKRSWGASAGGGGQNETQGAGVRKRRRVE